MNEEDIEVEVVDDTPEEDQVGPVDEASLERQDKATEANLAGKWVNPETLKMETKDRELPADVMARIRVLTFKAENHRRERDKADRERAAAMEYTKQLKTYADQMATRLSQIETGWKSEAVGHREAQIANAKAELAAAIEAGDAGRQANAQERIAVNAQDKRSFEGFQPQPYTTPAPPPEPEERVAQAAIDWAEDPKNSWFHTNSEMNATAVKISEYLKDKGVSVHNEQHYSILDTEMRKRFPDAFPTEKVPAQQQAPQKKSGTVAAAPRVNGAAAQSRKVQLSSSDLSMAKQLGLTPQQLAASKLALSQE